MPMHSKLAAGLQQAVHHQQPQHLLPTHRFAAFRQTLPPELAQPQLLPKFTGQPAVAERPRAPQLQPAQPHLDVVHGIFRQRAILGKQTQLPELLLLLIEDVQSFAPRRLLLAVDLAQVQHGPLHRLVRRDPLVLHDAEVAVVFAVFLSVCAAQKQGNSRMPQSRTLWKRVGLHSAVFQNAALLPLGLCLTAEAKWLWSAKVGLASWPKPSLVLLRGNWLGVTAVGEAGSSPPMQEL